MVWFFAGGETRDNKFNVFTGSFIRLMKQIMENDFDFVRGIYYRMPMMNVIWALNNAQKPITNYRKNRFLAKPFHLALGSTMISKESELFHRLENYHNEGIIEKFIHDDLQDQGDNSIGVGGKTKWEAFSNAFGLMMPVFSRKFKGPSFLNTHRQKGHIHRRRSQTVKKVLDFIEVLLVKHNLGGEEYRERAKEVIKVESKNI